MLVIFALAITVLFAAAGLAFDIGRFYSERRFLQNSADAAALAAGNALIRGETVTQADARAREVLTANFAHSPSGVVPTLPPASPVYEAGHAGDPDFLVNGILISGSEIRVAVQNPVGYTFGRIVGLDRNTIGGQARVNTNGNILPIAVRRFVNLTGPERRGDQPVPRGPERVHGLLRDGQHVVSRQRDECRAPDGPQRRQRLRFDESRQRRRPTMDRSWRSSAVARSRTTARTSAASSRSTSATSRRPGPSSTTTA